MRIPLYRSPTHPGEMLVQEFLAPLGLTQVELSRRIGVPFQRINQIANQKRAVTPDTALRLSRLFGTTPAFWLNLQLRWDLYLASHSPQAKQIGRIQPLKKRAS